MQKISFLIVVIFVSFNPLHAGYDNNGEGFFLNHYANMNDLKDTSCKTFLKTVFRGGQPVFDGSERWLKKLKASHVKRVFDLREETSNAIRERDILLKNGIDYVKIPLRTSGVSQAATMMIEVATPESITKKSLPTVEATKYVLSLMNEIISKQSTDETIYLHCQRGEDRTGLMIALLRQCNGTGWKQEFHSYGGVMYKPLQKLMNQIIQGQSNY